MVKVVEEEAEGFKGRILKKLWYWSIPQVVGAYLPPHHHRLQQKPPPPPFPVHHHHPPPSSTPAPLPSPLAPTSPDDTAGRALRQLHLNSPRRGAPPPNKQSINDVVDSEDHPAGKQAPHYQHCRRRPPHPTDSTIHVDELVRRHIEDSCEPEDMISCPVDVDKENTRPISIPPPPPSRPVSLRDTAPLISVAPKEDGSTAGIPPASARGQLDDVPTSSSSYRRPDFNSDSLFDPDLLAAFRRAVMEHALASEELRRNINAEYSAPKAEEEEEAHEDDDDDGEANDPLRGFELRCPPGGGDHAVVLYTTSLRGIRKTFEDCSSVRFLLQSLRVRFYERDVSMHLDYRDELWRVLGGRAVPPRLFVRGRYIGGADEVLCLHEQGRLLPLMRGMPADPSGGVPCRGCGGARFVMCSECSGSRRVYYYCYGGGGGGGGSGGDGGDVLHAVNYRHGLPYRSESARFSRIATN